MNNNDTDFVRPWYRHPVPVSLCLMMLSGCSATPSVVIMPSVNPVPDLLLAPCPAPPFTVRTWGEYPEYVMRLHLALENCNTDKRAIADILASSTEEKQP